MILTNFSTPWTTGSDYVMRTIKVLEESLEDDLDDIERRVVNYCNNISAVSEALQLGRNSQCKVPLDKVSKAFYRVLYKD